MIKQKLINRYFFIRYGDPDSHLRVRFHTSIEKLSQFLDIFNQWTLFLIQNKHMNRLSIDSYERELERYGGEKLIELAEALFCADSQTVIALLQMQFNKETNLPKECIAAISIINFLEQLGLKKEEQIVLFSNFEMDKKALAGFRKWKNTLITHIFEEQKISNFDHAFKFRNEAAKKYAKLLDSVHDLTNGRIIIYDSLIHMHCNRYLGKEKDLELKARLYAFHTLLASRFQPVITG